MPALTLMTQDPQPKAITRFHKRTDFTGKYSGGASRVSSRDQLELARYTRATGGITQGAHPRTSSWLYPEATLPAGAVKLLAAALSDDDHIPIHVSPPVTMNPTAFHSIYAIIECPTSKNPTQTRIEGESP